MSNVQATKDLTYKPISLKVKASVTTSISEDIILKALSPFMIVSSIEIYSDIPGIKPSFGPYSKIRIYWERQSFFKRCMIMYLFGLLCGVILFCVT